MQPHWRPYIVEVPITVDTDAYTANDVVGGSTTGYLTFDSPVPQISGGGYIAWVRMVDDSGQAEPYLLYVYDSVPSTIADDAAFAPVEADWLKTLGVIDMPAASYDATGDDSMIMVEGKDRKSTGPIYFDTLDTGKLYFRLVAVDTPDLVAADDLTIHVCLMLM